MNNDHKILGEYADLGYFTKEDADHFISVYYKDNGAREIAVFNQTVVTPEALQAVCKRHQATLMEAK